MEITWYTQVPSAADMVRRKYLDEMFQLTKRPIILYASSFTVKDVPGTALQIQRQDIQGFMSALVGIKGEALDLIVHSSGGSAEATEQLVNYLRGKFTDIRVFVPQNAMSAATMLACAADRIVMGKHSAIGPIDPQLIINNEMTVAAQSIIDEFVSAQQAITQGQSPILWIQKVKQYPPGLLATCSKVIQLAKQLVEEWLNKFMFAGDSQGANKAKQISDWLGDNQNFLTHGRSIGIEKARSQGLEIDALEDDQALQEAVLSVFHATMATFQTTPCCKIIENHKGKGAFALITKT